MRERDLTLRVLLDQLLESFTNIDGRLIRSLRNLFARPGSLTVSFLRGQRKPYLGPVALFLIFNVLFFAAESVSGGKVFTTPLDSHLHTQPWSDAVRQIVMDRIAARNMTLETYAPVFDQAVALKARSLIILMALVFALAPALLFVRTRLPLIGHIVFSLHLYAMLMLLLCIATLIPAISRFFGGVGLESEQFDHAIAVTLLLSSFCYIYFAVGRVYGVRGLAGLASSLLLTTAMAAVLLGYRFLLLVITLYVT
jgi:hypothetical protein